MRQIMNSIQCKNYDIASHLVKLTQKNKAVGKNQG